jgi:hypothetical protein
MLDVLKCATLEASSSFAEEAGRCLAMPQQPLLGVTLYLAGAFAFGNLLSVFWLAFGQSIA